MSRARIAAALVPLAVLAGCGGAPGPATPTASPVPLPPSSSPAPAVSPEERVCSEYGDDQSIVRRIANTLAQQPVLPAAIAIVLLDSRGIATTPGVTDPELLAAQMELIGAIDDLDAQGRALLPPGANPAQETVQLDGERILAAVTEIERVCAAR
ncbi:hypothetical protein ACVGOW_22630 [Pseudonocardia saturnea]